MKDDLIRRGEALAALNKQQMITKSVMRRVVMQVPAANAVEVVRCKDCKWRNTAGCPYMNFDAADREDSDFCSDGERRKTMIELEELCGKHFLQGVERGHTDAAETFMFRLDGVTYMAEEDPDDGYRNMMKSIEIVEAIPRYALSVEVMCSMDSNQDNDVLEMWDTQNGEIILRVGTEDFGDFYPIFVAEWMPEKMACNLEE